MCNKKCEVYSRIVGFYRPIERWNNGKKEEWKDRKTYDINKAINNDFVKEEQLCPMIEGVRQVKKNIL